MSTSAPPESPVKQHEAMPPPAFAALPPIATARPLGQPHAQQSHLHAGSNIPSNMFANGYAQASTATHAPTGVDEFPFTVTSFPVHAAGSFGHTQFEHLDSCRWVGGAMLAYYAATVLFLQPFSLGVAGILTGFVGYSGARPPMDTTRVKWLRGFVWMNYVMIVFNVWYIGVCAFIYNSSSSSYWGDSADRGSSNSTYDAQDDMNSYYYDQHLGLIVGLVIAVNLIVHVCALRSGRRFYAEVRRARPALNLNGAAVIIMAPATTVV